MTTLPTRAGSFSGNAFGIPIRLRLIAPSEREDIQGGVQVPVIRVSTRANVCPIRECLFYLWHRPARATRLRGVPRINRYYPCTSFFRFVREDVEEGCPTRVVRGLRKPSPGDALDVEGFVDDEAVGVYEFASLLVVKVPTLIRRFLVQAGDLLLSLAAAVGTFLFPGYRPLRLTKFLLRLPVVARRLDGLAVRGNEEALEPEVYTYRRSVSSDFRSIPEIAGEDHVPLAAEPLDGDGLDSPFDGAMQLDLDVPDMLKIQTPVVLQPAPVTVGGELDGPESTLGLDAGVAGSVPGLHAPEERLERLVQPAERGLSGGEVEGREARKNLAGLLEPSRLFAIGYGAFFGFVHVSPIAKSKVVQAAVRLKHRVQNFRLRAVRIEPIFERATHLSLPSLLSFDVAGDRRIGHVARTPDVVTATPERGHPGGKMLVVLAKNAGRVTLELPRQLRGRILGHGPHEQVNVVGLNREVLDFDSEAFGFLAKQVVKVLGYRPGQNGKAVLRAPDEVEVQVGNAARCSPRLHTGKIRDRYTECNLSNQWKGGAQAFTRQLEQTVPCA